MLGRHHDLEEPALHVGVNVVKSVLQFWMTLLMTFTSSARLNSVWWHSPTFIAFIALLTDIGDVQRDDTREIPRHGR